MLAGILQAGITSQGEEELPPSPEHGPGTSKAIPSPSQLGLALTVGKVIGVHIQVLQTHTQTTTKINPAVNIHLAWPLNFYL